jgi:integrase
MKKRVRQQCGSVVFDKRSKTWHFIWWENGKRRSKRIGSRREFRTKASAWKAAQPFVSALGGQVENANVPDMPVNDEAKAISVSALVQFYRAEKMPRRFSTSRGYESWLKNHILPRWGELPISEVQARPVELWLQSLSVAPRSKAHVRGMLRILWDYAMWRGDVSTQRNPIELVTVKGATKRTRQPRSLTVEEFRKFVQELEEPVRTIALVCVCFGLRISECLALKWQDVDWLNRKLRVERAIVRQRVDEVKTIYSGKAMSIDAGVLWVLKSWKQTTEFSSDDDWMFPSPVRLGRLPFSYPWVWQTFQVAGAKSGIGRLGTHSLRHSYRSWLDAVGTTIAVQQKLMRHSDIRTTLNIYGDVVTDEMSQANSKIAGLALNGL